MSQERFKPLPLEAMTPEQRAIADRLLNGPRKMMAGPFPMLMRSPGFADSVERMGDYLRFRTSVPQRLNELAILMTARKWASQFEWAIHRQLAEKAGVGADIADAIATGGVPANMKKDEHAVFHFCAALLQTGLPPEAETAAVIAEIGDQGLIDLVGTVGFYCLISMLLNVGKVPVPEGIDPPLAPVAPEALFT